MEKEFKKHSKILTEQLARLCTMRLVLETKHQILLSRSIFLSRFIKIAALEHVKDYPEIENARKLLSMTLPNFEISKMKPSWDQFNNEENKFNLGSIN